MTLEDQMLLEEYQRDRKRFREENKLRVEQQRHTAQGNHSDRTVFSNTETAIEGVM